MNARALEKTSFRAPGIARRKRLLAAARMLLRSATWMRSASPTWRARRAFRRVPHTTTTATFWICTFSSSPCSGRRCWRTCAGRSGAARRPRWTDIVAALVRRGAHYFNDASGGAPAPHQSEDAARAQAQGSAERQAHREAVRGADRSALRASAHARTAPRCFSARWRSPISCSACRCSSTARSRRR